MITGIRKAKSWLVRTADADGWLTHSKARAVLSPQGLKALPLSWPRLPI